MKSITLLKKVLLNGKMYQKDSVLKVESEISKEKADELVKIKFAKYKGVENGKR